MRTRRCYNCGAKLNRQLCFDFSDKTFKCDKCGALNYVYRIDVDDDAQDAQGGIGYGGQIRKFKAYVAGLDEKMDAASARGVNVHYLSKRLDLAKDRLETLERAYSTNHHMDCGYELYAISIELSSVDKKIDEHEREKRRAEKHAGKAERKAAKPRKTPKTRKARTRTTRDDGAIQNRAAIIALILIAILVAAYLDNPEGFMTLVQRADSLLYGLLLN